MRKPNFTLFLLVLSLFAFAACTGNGPDVDPEFTVLNYDDGNQDAPELPAGTYEGGARFLSNLMTDFTGDQLIEVQYYLKNVPKSGEIRIYSGSRNSGPRDLLYIENVTIGREEDSWNIHTLTDPITLNGDDLWIVYRFSHDQNLRVLGCDPGPASENGDWLWDSFDGLWRPLGQRSSLSINWNIRAVIDPS